MNWSEYLPLAGALASAVGVLLAIDQLTTRARMRRLALWAAELGEAEDDEGRKAALSDIRLWATGHVVASAAVPARMFFGILWLVANSLWLIARGPDSAALYVFIAVANALLLGFHYRRAIHLYYERQLVVAAYRRGGTQPAPRITREDQMGAGLTRVDLQALLAAVFTSSMCVGVALLVSDYDWAVPLVLLLVGGIGLPLILSLIWRQAPANPLPLQPDP